MKMLLLMSSLILYCYRYCIYENTDLKKINRSQTHECGNWDCGRAIPYLGIFVLNFRLCLGSEVFTTDNKRFDFDLVMEMEFLTQKIISTDLQFIYVIRNKSKIEIFCRSLVKKQKF